MTCPHLVDSGVYVLGALSPAQRLEFERHMATCAECKAEVNELAVLPGLLGRLDEPSVVATAELPVPSILPKVLARVHRQRRGRRVLAGAIAAVIAALALIAGFSLPPSSSSGPGASAANSASALPAGLTWHNMLPVGGNEAVTAQIAFTPVDGGTRIVLKCQYPSRYGTSFASTAWFGLYAVPSNGKPAQQLSTWSVTQGQDVAIPGTVTSWSVPQMSRIELRDSSGNPVLYYNL